MKPIFLCLFIFSAFISFSCLLEEQDWLRPNRLGTEVAKIERNLLPQCPKLLQILGKCPREIQYIETSLAIPPEMLGEINEKRSNQHNHNPCTCFKGWDSIDLGEHYFPRLLSVAKCDSQKCGNSPFHCEIRKHKFTVLRRRHKSEGISLVLPVNLREEFILVDVPVTVSCECVI